ncbi:hypothetical protein FUAX_50990 (plasmid) [Fulvitalea axinellae]|uniref:DUF4345 domain-containing protein n=1 Tax=Fulvitalea axinellae TaxID=1182444 RepID=A0AAU9D5M2_9BACT|nr:hypothetical protein FUAX_50990 [Fulvitalea axinellae]
MKNSKALKIYLLVAGALLAFIGGSTLAMPVAMKAGVGIDIAGSVSVINDTRAFGAQLLAFGLLTVSAVFVNRLSYTATLVSSLIFLSLGIGRALSLTLDGMPVDGLVKATVLEFVLGLIGLVLFRIEHMAKRKESRVLLG